MQTLLAMHSENAAFHLQERQWLRQHCALCSQWIACHSKIKQHYRLSHQAEYGMYAEEAGRLSARFNTPASPCEHCGSRVKAYRQHPSKCSVLWQISLMMRADRPGHGAAPGDVRVIGREPAQHDGLGAKQEGSRAGLGPSDRSKAQRTEQGKGRTGSQAPSNKPHWRRAGGKGRHADGPQQTNMIKALARLALQQETALKILRQDYT